MKDTTGYNKTQVSKTLQTAIHKLRQEIPSYGIPSLFQTIKKISIAIRCKPYSSKEFTPKNINMRGIDKTPPNAISK